MFTQFTLYAWLPAIDWIDTLTRRHTLARATIIHTMQTPERLMVLDAYNSFSSDLASFSRYMFVICLCWSPSTRFSLQRRTTSVHTLLFLITGGRGRGHRLTSFWGVVCLLGVRRGLEHQVLLLLLFLGRALGLYICVVLDTFHIIWRG